MKCQDPWWNEILFIVIYAAAEYVLGKDRLTPNVKSGSIPELLLRVTWSGMRKLAGWKPIEYTSSVNSINKLRDNYPPEGVQMELMTKAYDAKALAKKLQAKGLDVAEDAAKVIVEETLLWVQESAVISENKIDDMIAPLIMGAKPYILEQVDKIDGKVG